MAKFLGILMCLAGLLTGTASFALPIPAHPANWDQPFAPFRIIGNLYYVGTAGLSSFLIVTPKGDILLDGAAPSGGTLIANNIAALGFKLTDIKIILPSHAHFDHAGGLAALKAKSGAKFYASAADAPIFEKGQIGYGPSAGVDFAPVKADHIVADGEAVSLDGVTLTAHLTPGHTPGCTSWSFPVTDSGKTYQVLYVCSVTVGGNPLVGNIVYPAIVDDYRATFDKLQAMHADIFLTPHAEQYGLVQKRARLQAGAANPFVDPSELQRAVADVRKDFDVQLAKQKAAAH